MASSTNELHELFILLGIFGILFLCKAIFLYATTRTERLVIDKVRFGQDQGITRYMVYTRDGQVMRNKNSIFFMKFKSDELFMTLKPGKAYQVKTCGIRVPFLGWYKNIISAKEIKATPKKKHS